MYTQCPECHIAFRVTARILQQAAGRVQCGGCGSPFNAVEHLSEEPPPTEATAKFAAGDTAETGAAEDLNNETSPDNDDPIEQNEIEAKQSFEERSTQLLKALNELAGPEEVRIEDTGVEWRVLGADEDLDEALDADATYEKPAADATEGQTTLQFGSAVSTEQRYDDSTPLPDDYNDDEYDASPTPAPGYTPQPEEEPEDLPRLEDSQVDLALGDPDEWLDLIDEMHPAQAQPADAETSPAGPAEEDMLDVTGTAALRMEAEEELAAIHSELSATLEPYASTIGDPVDALVESGGAALEDEIPDVDAFAEEDDVADEFDTFDVEEDIADEIDLADEVKALDNDEYAVDADEMPDDDNESDDEDETPEPDEEETDDVATQEGVDELDDVEDAPEADALDDEVDALNQSTDDFREQIALIEDSLAGEQESDEKIQQDSSDDDESGPWTDTDVVEEHDIERELSASSEHDPTHTVNVQIHEDMRRAMDDEHFAATMTAEDGSPLIETIVMEGELVRGSIQLEQDEAESQDEAEREVPGDLDEPESLIDTYVLSRRRGAGNRFLSSSGKGVIAGVLVLIMLLAGQYIHTSREFLATYGMFNQTIGPVYRALGSPVTPAWDIKGWQFETTNGSTNEGDQLLTIYSSISNRSAQALPYPLVHVSLTDRWEEIIGSRVLEPNEYLAGNPDPRRPVAAGDKFTAVISIANPSAEVTGFKLNVCYRVSPERLSCAIEDFKN